MKNEISILVAAIFLSAGLLSCSPEKPADGKASGTNELVIANTDANALPSQEEDFSDETKAKLKKLREDAAILKAKAELSAATQEAQIADTNQAATDVIISNGTMFLTGKTSIDSMAEFFSKEVRKEAPNIEVDKLEEYKNQFKTMLVSSDTDSDGLISTSERFEITKADKSAPLVKMITAIPELKEDPATEQNQKTRVFYNMGGHDN